MSYDFYKSKASHQVIAKHHPLLKDIMKPDIAPLTIAQNTQDTQKLYASVVSETVALHDISSASIKNGNNNTSGKQDNRLLLGQDDYLIEYLERLAFHLKSKQLQTPLLR